MNDNIIDIQVRFDTERSDMENIGSDLNRVIANIARNLGSNISKPFEETFRRINENIQSISSSLDNPLTTSMKKISQFRRISTEIVRLVNQMGEDAENILPTGRLKEDMREIQTRIENITRNIYDLAHNNGISRISDVGFQDTGLNNLERTSEHLEEYIETLRRETEENNKNTESQRNNTRERLRNDSVIRKARNDLETYMNTDRQERWGDSVVRYRTQLIQEELELIEQIANADRQVEHTEQGLNDLLSTNQGLLRRRNQFYYELLEVQKQIAAARIHQGATGESLPEEEWKKLREAESYYKELVKMYDKQLAQNKEIRKNIEEVLSAERQVTEETGKQTDAEKQRTDEIKQAIKAEQENIKQAKAGTSQYYYRLRSIKMLNRYLQGANSALDKFGKKVVSVFSNGAKSIGKFITKFKPFNKNIKTATRNVNKHTVAVKNANSAHIHWGKTLKSSLSTLLKYTLGIRSLYVLMNRLRGAVGDGMQVMATQYSSVNATMSSIVTSINQMKNAITAAIQPLTLLLAPVLEHLSNMLSNVAVKIASFFAAFTGQKIVYKAIRVNKEYIESLKKQKKAMKELNQEQLAHYDMLNIIDQKKEDEDEEDISDLIGFEEIPIEANKAIVDFINKLKDLIKQFLQPIIDAWNKWKEAIKEALRKLWKALKKLIKDIIRDFLQAWQEFGQQIAETIFAIIKDIIDFIRIIIEKIDEAWNHAENGVRNGLRIWRAIMKIVLRILRAIKRMTGYLVSWAEDLNLIPLFTALAEALEEVEQNIQNILDLIFTLWQGFLEIVKYILERFGPKLLDLWSDLYVIANNIAGQINKALSDGDDIFDESDRLYRMLQQIEAMVDTILDGIKLCLEATKEWSAELDFEPLFKTMERMLETKIRPAVEKIVNLLVGLYINVVLPMLTWVIEDALPQIEHIIGKLISAVGNIADGISKALSKNNNVRDIVLEIQEILKGVLNLIEWCADHTEVWAKNLNFTPYIESLKKLLVEIQPLLEFIMQVIGLIYRDVILKFVGYLIEEGLPKLNQMIGEIVKKVDWDHLINKVSEFLDAFEKFLEKAWEAFIIILGDLGDAFAKFVNSETFDHIVDTLIYWMDKADPEDMAKGIEKLVITFIKLKAALTFLAYTGQLREFVMTLINWGNNLAMTKTIAKSTKAINEFKGELAALGGGAEVAAAGMSELDPVAAGVATDAEVATTSIGGLIGTIGGIASVLGGAVLSLTGFLDQLTNGFSITGIAATAFGDALIGLGLVVLGVATGPVGAAIAITLFAVQELFVALHERIKAFGESLPEAINSIIDSIAKAITSVFDKAGELIGKAVAGLLHYIVDTFVTSIHNFDGDWFELGLDIIKGILKAFFFLPGIIIQAIVAFIKGFINGLKDGFQTHSPSRHPEIIQIGVDIVLGLLNGILSFVGQLASWLITNLVIPFLHSVQEAFASIWSDIQEIGKSLMLQLMEGISSILGRLKDFIFEKWQEIKSETERIWNDIVNRLKEFWNTIKTNAQTLYEEIRKTIESKWDEMRKNAETWWNNITSYLKDTWVKLSDEVKRKFEEIRKNVEEKWKEVKRNTEEIWNRIKSFLEGKWKDIVNTAKSKFEDLRRIIQDKWREVKSNAEDAWNAIKDAISRKIDALRDLRGKLEDIGHFLIDGLKHGIEAARDGVFNAISDVCSTIGGGIADFFDIHSPSRVFEYYGDMLMEGLAEGIEENADKATDAYDELAPGDDMLDTFYNHFISMLSTLRQDAVSMTSAMIDDMLSVMSKLDNMDVLNSTIASLNKIDIPDIASGKVVSPQIEMIINKDNSKLEKLLQEVLDKMDDLPDTNDRGDSNNSPIVLQLDKAEIARAVWDEQAKRYRQLGKYPVFE